jgi:outer membrane lipoprotein-sorting protein
MFKKPKSRLMLFIVSLVIIGSGLVATSHAVEFSADTIQKSPMGNSQGKVFVKGQNIRQEMTMGGQKQIMIFQKEKGVALVLMPEMKMYMEIPVGGQENIAPPTPEEMENMAEKKYLGQEKVNGYKCKKYLFTPSDPSVGTTTMWISNKLNFPIKTETKSSSGPMLMEYKNIKEKKIPDSLFTIPAGYQKMSMPTMPKMPSMPNMPKQ